MDIQPLNATDPVNNVEKLAETLSLGQWCWVKDNDLEWLACIQDIGSNYVQLTRAIEEDRIPVSIRIAHNDLNTKLRYEPDGDRIIQQKIDGAQNAILGLLETLDLSNSMLGISPAGHQQSLPGSTPTTATQALSVLAQTQDINHYKHALTAAYQTKIPQYLSQIEKAQTLMAQWQKALVLPLKIKADAAGGSLTTISHRLFNLNLYTGYSESLVHCQHGEPANLDSKLHIMQRKLYMDEECLMNYQHGGMTFKDIEQFDQWLCLPDNLNRILPFPRTLVAMQVRRPRDQSRSGALELNDLIDIDFDNRNHLTFMYLRNGQNVYRLSTSLEFDELIFLDADLLTASEALMVRTTGYRRKADTMPVREFEEEVKLYEQKQRQLAQWQAENPEKIYRKPAIRQFNPDEWEPMTNNHLYYDEFQKTVTGELEKFNRIALIVQGLFDRSPVFDPHLPVKTWKSASFSKNIELVKDGSKVLNYGNPPDFEEYRNQCNAQVDSEAVFFGQQLYWLLEEGKKETQRRKQLVDKYDLPDASEVNTYQPNGNPGPGLLAKGRLNKATQLVAFTWYREGRGKAKTQHLIKTTLTVPINQLINISAYQPGDYKKFFSDPRSRARYLEWAPVLLLAEDYQSDKNNLST